MVENQILVVGRESLVRKGQEIERCVKMPFVNEVTNDIVQTIVSFLLIE